jgi:hypothetical protein
VHYRVALSQGLGRSFESGKVDSLVGRFDSLDGAAGRSKRFTGLSENVERVSVSLVASNPGKDKLKLASSDRYAANRRYKFVRYPVHVVSPGASWSR